MDIVQLIAAFNAALAFLSFVTLQWAVPKVGMPLKLIFIVASALALFYSGAYIWLALHTGSGAAWSEFMRWVSLTSWPLIWMAPAWAAVRTRAKRNEMIREAVKKAADI